MSTFDFREGELLLVDKPLEWTSFDVVNKLRNAILRTLQQKKIKVGHAGTLDPLATGLLLICTGRYTKKLTDLQGADKEYTGVITLGATTPSYDRETEVAERFPVDHLTEADIMAAAAQLTGSILQTPPAFSAKRVGGEKSYHKVRRGESVKLSPNPVTIHAFEITQINLPDVAFRIVCSKGTYIRSMAYDFGRALGNGGHLSALCRTQIGDYRLDEAMSLESLLEQIARQEPPSGAGQQSPE